MVSFISPNGERYNAQTELSVRHGVNGELSLSGIIHTNDSVLHDIDRGWRLEFDGEIFVVTFAVPKDYGNVIETEFDAVHEFFYDFAHDVVYDTLNGSHTFEAYMNFIFQDSGYSFRNETSAYALDRQEFGNATRLSLFNRIIQDSGVEFSVSGRVVRIVNRVGSDLTTKVEKNFNMQELRLEKNINDFITYKRGLGAWFDEDDPSQGRLEVEYESPLAAEYGRLHGTPIVDERYSVEENLYNRLKADVDGSYSISVQLSMEDLTKAGYDYEQPRTGDWIMAINRDLGFERRVRIVSYTSQYDVNGDLINHDVVCNSIGSVEKMESDSAGIASQIRQLEESMDRTEEQITRMLVNAQGTARVYHGNTDPQNEYDIREGDIWFDDSQGETQIKKWNGNEWVPATDLTEITRMIELARNEAESARQNAQKSLDQIEGALDDSGEVSLADLFARMIKDEDFETLFYQQADSIGITYTEGGIRKAIIAIQDGLPYIMGEHIILDGNTIVDGSFTVSEEMIAPEAIIGHLEATGIDATDVNIINLNADSMVGGQLDLSKGITIGHDGNEVLSINEQGEVVLNVSKLTIGVRDIEDELDRISEFEDGKSAYEIAVEQGFEGTEQEWLDSLKGSDGSSGVGIVDSTVTYQNHTNGTTAPTGTWTNNPNPIKGQYLWTRTVTTYTEGDPITTYAVAYNALDGQKGDEGSKGDDGTGISDTVIRYFQSSSGTTPPTGSGATTPPEPIQGQYNWTRTVISYTDGSSSTAWSTSYNAIDGEKGDTGSTGAKGDDGKGITAQTVTYQNHTNGTTAPTGSWSNSPNPVKGRYLWTRTVTTYTEGDPVTTYAVAYNATDGQNGSDGSDGKDGTGITSSQIRYQQSTSGSTIPTGTWHTTIPSPTKGRYLWTRTVITYSDGTSSTAYSTSYYATDGQKGDKGDTGDRGATGPQGRSITSVDLEYYLSTSQTTQTGGSWVTSPPNWVDGRYMWTRTRTKFSSGNDSLTTPVNVTGSRGQTGSTGSTGSRGATGATGRGIGSLQTEYYLSNSKTSRTGGSWSTNQPTWEQGKYVWTRIRINLTNPSGVDYTEPDVDASWEAIDGIEIGGRNLLFDSEKTANWSPYSGATETKSDIDMSDEWGYTATKVELVGGTSVLAYLSRAVGMAHNEWYTYSTIVKNVGTKDMEFRFNGLQSSNFSTTTIKPNETLEVVATGKRREAYNWMQPMIRTKTIGDTIEFIIGRQKFEKGNKATDWTPAPEDVDEEINKKADDITVSELDEALSNLESVSATREELGEILSTLNDYKDMIEASEIDLNDAKDDIGDLLARVPLIESNLGDFVEQWNFLETYVRMGDEGLLIQEQNGSTGIRITTDRIDFLDGSGEPVAYITNQVMRINRGIFVDSAQIGEHKIETISGGHTIWQWIPNPE